MTQSLTERCDRQIAGELSCYDRVVITGTVSACQRDPRLADGGQISVTGKPRRTAIASALIRALPDSDYGYRHSGLLPELASSP
jgi:hypothetical protein